MNTNTNNVNRLDYYIKRKLKIFPCLPNDKNPLTTHGFKDASADKQVINDWWDKHPNANIGLPTGKTNNLVVVDVDVKNDAGGMASLKQLQDECGEFDTRVVHTPSGGLHFYFKYPQDVDTIKNRTNMKPGVDIRADGGYVIAPGSSIDSNYYKFDDKNKEAAGIPNELLAHLINTKTSGGFSTENIIDGVAQGGRNDFIFKLAYTLRKKNTSYDVAESKIIIAARNCTPPLPEHEARKCLDSAWKYPPGYKKSDVGNADRLINKHGANIRYIHEHKSWIYWADNRWKIDNDGEIFRRAKDTILDIHAEVVETDSEHREALSKFAIRSENKRSLDNMISIAGKDKEVVMSQSSLDKNHYLLGVENGTVDLRTGKLEVSDRANFITKHANVTHMADANCPKWLKFVNEIMDNDQEMVNYLQKVVGYSLTGDTTAQKFFFLHGSGANGKSVFIETISELLGDYSMQTPVSTLMTKATGSINNDVARLKGARFVAATETEEHSKFNESELKQLVGGDTITARFLHQEYFEFLPEFKLWISGNHKPVTGDGYGMWRRLILIPFNVKFAKKDRDSKLKDKLRQEMSGILNWAIEGCIKWKIEDLKTPRTIQSAINEYKSEMDIIQHWIDDCWQTNAAASSTIKATELYRSYKVWADTNGERFVLTHNKLGRKLTERGIEKNRTQDGTYYLGVTLKLFDVHHNEVTFSKITSPTL